MSEDGDSTQSILELREQLILKIMLADQAIGHANRAVRGSRVTTIFAVVSIILAVYSVSSHC